MARFNDLLKQQIVKIDDKSNFNVGLVPDGIWDLQNTKLLKGHLLGIDYQSSIDDLPKLIIDSYINRHGEVPNEEELTELLNKIRVSMERAIEVANNQK